MAIDFGAYTSFMANRFIRSKEFKRFLRFKIFLFTDNAKDKSFKKAYDIFEERVISEVTKCQY